MKRKFSFKLAPIKVPTANEEEYTMDGVDSPPFSPVSFIIERPHLSPQTYLELHRSCATIVQELQPVDHHVYESIAASNKFPGKWSDDNQAYKAITQAQNPKPKTHRRTDSAPIFAPKPYTHIPTNAATSFKATATTRKPSYAIEIEAVKPTNPPAFSNPPTTRSKPQAVPDPSSDPLAHIRADIASRPKTSAAACIDYAPASTTTSTSTSTSRSNTTYAPAATGLTSLALTPGSSRLSSQTPHDTHPSSSSAAAAATAKAWMAQELARRRSEAEKAVHHRAQHYNNGGVNPSRPSARGSMSDPGPRREVPDQATRSRSGSISQGIKDYIRPRGGSIDSVRTSHSTSDFHASPHSSNSNSNNKWSFPAALKRKGSWSSFRSFSRPDPEGSDGSEASGGGVGTPDLNRALPALPGLETYREDKGTERERRRPVHVGLMMRAVGKREEGKREERTPVSPGLVKSTRVEERKEVGGTFEERMRVGALDEKRHTRTADPQMQDIHPLLRPQCAAVGSGVGAAGEKTVQAVMTAEKKPGLRKRLSRFWGRGRGRGVPVGVAVVAN